MGTWGPGIFSDDLACEVRSRYRDLVAAGHDGPDATDALVSEFQPAPDDPDSAGVFWIALAVTQWKLGRLEDRVKGRAGAAATLRSSQPKQA